MDKFKSVLSVIVGFFAIVMLFDVAFWIHPIVDVEQDVRLDYISSNLPLSILILVEAYMTWWLISYLFYYSKPGDKITNLIRGLGKNG